MFEQHVYSKSLSPSTIWVVMFHDCGFHRGDNSGGFHIEVHANPMALMQHECSDLHAPLRCCNEVKYSGSDRPRGLIFCARSENGFEVLSQASLGQEIRTSRTQVSEGLTSLFSMSVGDLHLLHSLVWRSLSGFQNELTIQWEVFRDFPRLVALKDEMVRPIASQGILMA